MNKNITFALKNLQNYPWGLRYHRYPYPQCPRIQLFPLWSINVTYNYKKLTIEHKWKNYYIAKHINMEYNALNNSNQEWKQSMHQYFKFSNTQATCIYLYLTQMRNQKQHQEKIVHFSFYFYLISQHSIVLELQLRQRYG